MIDLKELIIENQNRENITKKEEGTLRTFLNCFVSKYPIYSVSLGSTTSSNNYWHTVYYDSKIDNIYDAVERITENIVAFVSVDYKWAFVLNQYMEKFKEDTLEYNMTYINVDSFDNENIKCSDIELLSREFNYVTWIDDDFMNDENIMFNYESFYKIDEHVKYLNPNHFSVKQLIKFPIIFKQDCKIKYINW